MKKKIVLKESELVKLVKRIIKEQQRTTGLVDPKPKRGMGWDEKAEGQDYDHFNRIVYPQMTRAGFEMNKWECDNLPLECCAKFVYPDETGVNLMLDCNAPSYKFKYVVFSGNGKNRKEFGWTSGTMQEMKKAAQDAVNHALDLKEMIYNPSRRQN